MSETRRTGPVFRQYRMKQSTGPTDVSIRAFSTAPSRRCDGHPVMQRNLGRPLTTREIAAAAGTSERSLRRQFQRFTGQSPIAFHRHLRLEAIQRQAPLHAVDVQRVGCRTLEDEGRLTGCCVQGHWKRNAGVAQRGEIAQLAFHRACKCGFSRDGSPRGCAV
jgi:hypothetical protein